MEKRTEDYINATEHFINCFGVEKLETARGWALSLLLFFVSLVFWPRTMSMTIMMGETNLLAVFQRL